MNVQEIHARLRDAFPAAVLSVVTEALDPWIEIRPEALPEICCFLRDQGELAFDMLHCITAVDYFEPDAKKAAGHDWQPHIELIYHLSSLRHRHRVVLKLHLPRWRGDKPGKLPELATVSEIWGTADWHEREVFDLMGVQFVGHPDLRRILCAEDWQGHPLRKDYVTPTEYHGIPAG
jgi:NADH-quinone oxidoreductase subunit C